MTITDLKELENLLNKLNKECPIILGDKTDKAIQTILDYIWDNS